MGIEPFDRSATQTLNGSYILDVIVGDSLSEAICYLISKRNHQQFLRYLLSNKMIINFYTCSSIKN